MADRATPRPTLHDAAALEPADVLARLATTGDGLSAAEVDRRLAEVGPNALRTHGARPWRVLASQFRSPMLLLLLVTASVSFFVGDRNDAVVIGAIVALSVGLGFVNEYRAERAVELLHENVRHTAVVRRDGPWAEVDMTQLVPGDVVRLSLGHAVPADVRLLQVAGLECDEGVLTGESATVAKQAAPVAPNSPLADWTSCAFMGTVVTAGTADAVVVATGTRTEFGRVAAGLGERQAETEFQRGLRQFSGLLVRVAAVLSVSILVINLVLERPFVDAVLFSLAIAVGITPQLLPAVVTTSLATGSRRLAHKEVLVKRLVCIEDLGDIDLLFTDKTGTLTEGRLTYLRAVDGAGQHSDEALRLGLLCTEAPEGGVGANPLDAALWSANDAAALTAGWKVRAVVPFDHDRRITSALVDRPDGGRLFVSKGAPESIAARCVSPPDAAAQATLDQILAEGGRVVAVARRDASGQETASTSDEHDLVFVGFLVFEDPPRHEAAAALARLHALGVTVKVITGDHPTVAEKVCRDLGLEVAGSLAGPDIDALDDEALGARIGTTTVFARVSPEQKARIVRVQRTVGSDVAFLGDGVNDALALHAADVGISVESGTDIAKDAADVVLLRKDLGVLADGVAEGRRTFANTIKYVQMGTSSNFGNMFSAAAASAFLSFLPMLPSQILLNNLLYDASQMTIPTDRVDEEQLERPAHWDLRRIRRFMTFFGPISSVFDFVTFAVLLQVFDAGPDRFRSGWFVESLATQTLVIFVIRTRRIPFFRSRPSTAMAIATVTVVAIGAVIPALGFAHDLGFSPLPASFYFLLAGMVLAYLVLVEAAKHVFEMEDRLAPRTAPRVVPPSTRAQRVRRRASKWSVRDVLPGHRTT